MLLEVYLLRELLTTFIAFVLSDLHVVLSDVSLHVAVVVVLLVAARFRADEHFLIGALGLTLCKRHNTLAKRDVTYMRS